MLFAHYRLSTALFFGSALVKALMMRHLDHVPFARETIITLAMAWVVLGLLIPGLLGFVLTMPTAAKPHGVFSDFSRSHAGAFAVAAAGGFAFPMDDSDDHRIGSDDSQLFPVISDDDDDHHHFDSIPLVTSHFSGPDFNVNGMPMIEDTMIDVTGHAYGDIGTTDYDYGMDASSSTNSWD